MSSSVVKQTLNTHWLTYGSFTLRLPLFFSSTSSHHTVGRKHVFTLNSVTDSVCCTLRACSTTCFATLLFSQPFGMSVSGLRGKKNPILSPCQSTHQQPKDRMHIYNAEFGAWFCFRESNLFKFKSKASWAMWEKINASLITFFFIIVFAPYSRCNHGINRYSAQTRQFDFVLLDPAGFPPKY